MRPDGSALSGVKRNPVDLGAVDALRRHRLRDPLAVQALYYLATGVWPVVHLRSFYAVTGPKREGWLVQTFGLLVGAIGLVLLPRRTGAERRIQEQLANASSVALISAELFFVARRRISPIYLFDALGQAVLVATLRRR